MDFYDKFQQQKRERFNRNLEAFFNGMGPELAAKMRAQMGVNDQSKAPEPSEIPANVKHMIQSFGRIGAQYRKHDDKFMFFDIPKSSPLHADQDARENMAYVIRTMTGLGLRVKLEK